MRKSFGVEMSNCRSRMSPRLIKGKTERFNCLSQVVCVLLTTLCSELRSKLLYASEEVAKQGGRVVIIAKNEVEGLWFHAVVDQYGRGHRSRWCQLVEVMTVEGGSESLVITADTILEESEEVLVVIDGSKEQHWWRLLSVWGQDNVIVGAIEV
jgi:hypothetical protein